MNRFKALVPGLLLLGVFAVFTLLIATCDVQAVGAEGSDIGFASLNTDANQLFGAHKSVYTVTKFLGYLTWGVVAFFGLFGLSQLVKRKSLLKVDADILLLGAGYAIMLALYILFDHWVINYRPPYPWAEEALEPSYPSSHTLMLVFVMLTAVMQISARVRKDSLRKILSVLCVLVACVVSIGRLVAGVHWLTDVIGGVLLGSALAVLYCGLAFGAKRSKSAE